MAVPSSTMAQFEPTLPTAGAPGAAVRPASRASEAMLIKGTALRSVVGAIERVAGPEGFARVRAVLPPEVRAEIDRGLLATRGYPASFCAALHEGVRDALGGGTWIMNHKIGVEAARIDYGGVYRAILWTFDVDGLLERLVRSWRQYNSAGSVTIEKGSHRASACVEGVAGFNLGMWTSIAGRIEGLLTMSGAKGVVARVASSNETSCRIDIRWAR